MRFRFGSTLPIYTVFAAFFPFTQRRPKTADAQWWNENNTSVFLVLTNTIGLRSQRSPLLTVRTVFDRFSARWAKKYIRIYALTKENTFNVDRAWELQRYHDSHQPRSQTLGTRLDSHRFFFLFLIPFFFLLCVGLNLSKSWHELIWLRSCRVGVN